MPSWYGLLPQLGLDITVYLAGAAFLWPLRRREGFPLRLALCLAGGCVLSVGFFALRAALPISEDWLVVPNALWLVVRFLVLIAQSRLCVRCTLSTGAYCAAWALVVQQLTYEVWLVLCAIPGWERGPVLLTALWFAVVYGAVSVTVARWMPDKGEYHVGPRQLSLAVLMAVISGTLYQFFFYLASEGSIPRVIITLIHFYCATVFYLQSVLFQKSAMRQELMTFSLLWQQSKAKYSLTKENIDLINRKCHDLKHQMRALKTMEESEERRQYVSELERSIQIYDAIVKTGNEALDTILTEKSLYCEANHILVNCVADGSRLDFINPVDLYAIFGNAMDNAIEGVQGIGEDGRRVIDVLVYVKQQFLAISITNPVDGARFQFEDGLPITTKEKNGYHGFGLKSIRHTVEKYGGFVTVEAKDGCFSLRILFPLPA